MCTLALQVSLNGEEVSIDDSNIAWKTDVDDMFADVPTTNFNTVPALRGGATINGTLQVIG